MFAIPIAIIVFFIWYAQFCVHTYGYAKFDAQAKIEKNMIDSVSEKYTDHELEQWIYYHTEKKYDMQEALIEEMMGQDRVWQEFFMGNMHFISQMILLARQGKIHSFFVYGNQIPHWFIFDGTTTEIATLQEKFALRLEDELHLHGATDLYVAFHAPGETSITKAVPLREFVNRYGYGATKRNTRFTFITR